MTFLQLFAAILLATDAVSGGAAMACAMLVLNALVAVYNAGGMVLDACGEWALSFTLAEYTGMGEICCGAALLGSAAAASQLQKKSLTDADLLDEVSESLQISRRHEGAVRALLASLSEADIEHREIVVDDPLAPRTSMGQTSRAVRPSGGCR